MANLPATTPRVNDYLDLWGTWFCTPHSTDCSMHLLRQVDEFRRSLTPAELAMVLEQLPLLRTRLGEAMAKGCK